MAKKSIIARETKRKFRVRVRNRCQLCGRPRAVYQKFKLCRICFRKMCHDGLIPGAKKASW